MKQAKSQSSEMDLNEIAMRYKVLQAEKETLDKLLAGYRAALESAAIAANGTVETSDFKITATPARREVFCLKLARLKIDSKLLAKFTRISRYNRVKVSERGEALSKRAA